MPRSVDPAKGSPPAISAVEAEWVTVSFLVGLYRQHVNLTINHGNEKKKTLRYPLVI